MVPEWKGAYPMQEVGELGVALTAGNTSLAMKTVGAVGGICHRCHQAAMVSVQHRYRWGNMGAVKIKDPVGDSLTGYSQFKGAMAANLAGITVDLKQGQPGNARKQYEAFRARFQALGDSCYRCHEQGGRYYTDGDMQGTLEDIGKALSNDPPDMKVVMSLVQKIGGESCSKCHLVHVPAALAASVGR
jgi:cytochrome c556